jgi:effector-binding domain-containing protein
MNDSVELIEAPRQVLAVERFHILLQDMDTMGERISNTFGSVASRLARAGAAPIGPPVGTYLPTIAGFDVAAGFPVDPSVVATDGIETIEVGGKEVAHLVHAGSYESLPEAYGEIESAAAEHGDELETNEPMWEVYLTGPDLPPEETFTEIFWPLRRG